jgi:hypothetical protein
LHGCLVTQTHYDEEIAWGRIQDRGRLTA